MAESLLNHLGKARFRAFSAGSHPSGAVNPLVAEFLRTKGLCTDNARSKSWDEFAAQGAPQMDLVITVCDQAAGDTCPVWPGHPAGAHWSAPDPAAYMHDPVKAREVIRDAFRLMHERVSRLVSLPVEQLDHVRLECEAKKIAQATGTAPASGAVRTTS